MNLGKLNPIWIVFTFFRLIYHQIGSRCFLLDDLQTSYAQKGPHPSPSPPSKKNEYCSEAYGKRRISPFE